MAETRDVAPAIASPEAKGMAQSVPGGNFDPLTINPDRYSLGNVVSALSLDYPIGEL